MSYLVAIKKSTRLLGHAVQLTLTIHVGDVVGTVADPEPVFRQGWIQGVSISKYDQYIFVIRIQPQLEHPDPNYVDIECLYL